MASRPTAVLFLLLATAGIASAALSWERQFLDPHNKARKAVKVPNLSWDRNLAKYAQNWANKQARNNCQLKTSNGPYGENMYWSSRSSTPLAAVNAFVKEKQNYNHASNTCKANTRNSCRIYTQVVWKKTTKLGCASSRCPTGGTITVCSYNPPGNFVGQRPY
ncbi:pathogenesis-related protein 1 [Marchantia polymorpha subsp. ruderalis]|uniref:SCP domain-containing protein n=2 Tax=Marchantia polymorpha TaxID=3197 RepID=A0AAF6B0L8_MARPO|nr:hypothetical protein MARPO_0004s0260 [Marchantia polymorpha]BBN05552.1 hypothetical protein Mp_3g14110 [Marchantia polymorpha subsp. ruderalis]|eukprot:PTQ49030.1 hypothetical protein MARPO_0004s0260 [Marchantia polymorpha]